MTTTRISRGFRRLSVLVGSIAFLCALAFIAPDEEHHWDGSLVVDQPNLAHPQLTPVRPPSTKDHPFPPTNDELLAAKIAADKGSSPPDAELEDSLVPVGSSSENLTEPAHPLRNRVFLVFLAVTIPMILTLLVGWVVTGFRHTE